MQSNLVKFSPGFSFVYPVIILTVMFDRELAEAGNAVGFVVLGVCTPKQCSRQQTLHPQYK